MPNRTASAGGDQAARRGAIASTADKAPERPNARLNDVLYRDRRTTELEREIQSTEEAINSRNGCMDAEMQALRNQERYARNNLAGATWEQSLSTEMQAVAMKYKTMNDIASGATRPAAR